MPAFCAADARRASEHRNHAHVWSFSAALMRLEITDFKRADPFAADLGSWVSPDLGTVAVLDHPVVGGGVEAHPDFLPSVGSTHPVGAVIQTDLAHFVHLPPPTPVR